jgi:hypothetical protein
VRGLVASALVPQQFSPDELEELERRANELAVSNEADAGLRTALQAFAETAANLAVKIRGIDLLGPKAEDMPS